MVGSTLAMQLETPRHDVALRRGGSSNSKVRESPSQLTALFSRVNHPRRSSLRQGEDVQCISSFRQIHLRIQLRTETS